MLLLAALGAAIAIAWSVGTRLVDDTSVGALVASIAVAVVAGVGWARLGRTQPIELVATTVLLIVCFAALGAGNGALFQLVPLRWPTSTAVAGSMIGEIGALGGGLVPNAMGLSKQYLGSYMWGFFFFAVLALVMLGVMRMMQLRWTRTWAERGGRARLAAADGVAAARA